MAVVKTPTAVMAAATNTNLDSIKSNPSTLSIYLSRISLKKDGKEWISKCPFHSERSASFHVHQYQSGWCWKCFGCGIGGDVVAFLQKFESVGFKEAVELAERELGQSFDKTKKAASVFSSLSEPASVISYPLSEYKKYEDNLANSPEAIKWLENRGIKYETAKALKTGYRNYSKNNLSSDGWIIFPSIRDSRVVALKYRSINDKAFKKQPGMACGEGTPLYNEASVNPLDPIYLVEGELDCLTLEAAGFRGCSVQSASTPLTAANKELLLTADYIVLAGDNDTAGNDYMDSVWKQIGERCYKLVWPAGMKDANQIFTDHCGGDIEKFRELVEQLTTESKSILVPGMSSLAQTLKEKPRTDTFSDPRRWVWPFPQMDSMATVMPGSVVYLSATNTGMGKTSLMMNASVYNAMNRGAVIVNYSAELSNEEYAQIVVAHLMKKSRHQLTEKDYSETYRMISDTRYYIGRDNDLPSINDAMDLMEAAIRRCSATVCITDTVHFLCVNEKDTIKAQENYMNRCKSLAQKYGVIWFNLGQPRKAQQQFKGKPIHVTDAKGSEALISSSDVAYAIHRELAKVDDPSNPPKEPYESRVQVFLQKGRNQGTGSAYTELMFDGETCSFFPTTKQEPPEGLFQ